ncbi:MAG: polyprenyl synthetase family protein, partial [Thermoplasmata archaeon]
RKRFRPKHIHDAVYSLIGLGGKSLRPMVLLFSCGAVGGNEEEAIPAAVAIEVYHTWTLVHDDIIDRDEKRRRGLTVHEEFYRRARDELDYEEDYARHYGMSVAMLAGDVQQGWAISLLCELTSKHHTDPNVTLYLIHDLESYVMNALVDGETEDVQYSQLPVESLTEDKIVEMLKKKTGVMYEFAGRAGAMIGLNSANPTNALVRAISQFTCECGTAFQLQDDILGVLGSEDKLGKPVGSDIREGKRTTIVHYAFSQADDRQKKRLLEILGNRHATEEEVREATEMLIELGGVRHTREMAREIIEKRAMRHLDVVPESEYKNLLLAWAEYMIRRDF